MAAYTTEKLLAAIERRSFIPDNQSTYTAEEQLMLADELIETDIVPAVLQIREGFFEFIQDYSVVGSQARYAIPYRASGAMVREVHWIRTDGTPFFLDLLNPSKITNQLNTTTNPEGYYLQGNNIVLCPIPTESEGTLRVYYYIRRGSLVDVIESGVISSIDTTTNTVILESIPGTWTSGQQFDIIAGDGGHEYKSIDLQPTLISGPNITFESLPEDLKVGDYVSLAGTSPLVQLPPGFGPVLADLVAAEMLDSMGQPNAQTVRERAQKRLENAQRMLSPRVTAEDYIIVPDWS